MACGFPRSRGARRRSARTGTRSLLSFSSSSEKFLLPENIQSKGKRCENEQSFAQDWREKFPGALEASSHGSVHSCVLVGKFQKRSQISFFKRDPESRKKEHRGKEHPAERCVTGNWNLPCPGTGICGWHRIPGIGPSSLVDVVTFLPQP